MSGSEEDVDASDIVTPDDGSCGVTRHVCGYVRMRNPQFDAVAASMRVLIVDDSGPARERLRLLAEAVPDMIVVGECADGREAVDAIRRSELDLVFLDVDMPRLDGFGVVAEVGAARMPPLVFTSAYSEFAVRAFESYALDYLLKPFDDTRFLAAVARVRRQIDLHHTQDAERGAKCDSRLLGLDDHLSGSQPAAYREAIAIRTGNQYEIIRVPDIDWIEAAGNYSKVYLSQRSRILTKTLGTLEREVLDPSVFIRVHRSAIVNSTKIASVETHFHGQLTLGLHNGAQVQCSRRFRHLLEQRVYFTT